MKVLLIVNPQSGVRSSKNQLVNALAVFSKHKYNVEVYTTQSQGDAYNYLKRNKKHYDIVCCAGGDGTVNEVTNALMTKKDKPLLGYFPSGTMNDFGSNFDLGNDWGDIAERICAGKYKEFDLGLFEKRYFNYVAAFGAMTDVPYSTKRNIKEAFGNFAYFMEGISKLNEVHPVKVKVTIDGKTRTYNTLFGLVFSGGRVAGTELVSKNKSNVNDGKFNIMLVDYVETPIPWVPDLLRTVAEQKKHIHWFNTSEVTLEFEDRLDWTLDGEKASCDKRVTIKNINKALRMLS